MNVDELNAKYDEIYNRNAEIQQLLTEVKDYNDILFFLYGTEIKRPNIVLNTMIDNYEGLIFKLRESHKEIKASLKEFGDEQELAEGVSNNDNLSEKVKELILWKLRRLFMVYDEEPILPYVKGDFLAAELIGKTKTTVPSAKPTPVKKEDNSPRVTPEGGVFPEKEQSNDKN
ncbi:hypothetical protein KJ966_07315 [bacterium]|nr:hypothetical protein [bacterium]